MAFTFSTPTTAVGANGAAVTLADGAAGSFVVAATTDTASAAGTFNCPFFPSRITVYQQTTPAEYAWMYGMSAGYMKKITAAGVMTTEATNGITVTPENTGVLGNGPARVTLGTGCHTNSATFRIVCER
jgi:hypothetical protein